MSMQCEETSNDVEKKHASRMSSKQNQFEK